MSNGPVREGFFRTAARPGTEPERAARVALAVAASGSGRYLTKSISR